MLEERRQRVLESLRDLAAQHGLLTTGSSDYHGSNKQTPIGACTTDPAQFEALLAAGTGTSVLDDRRADGQPAPAGGTADPAGTSV